MDWVAWIKRYGIGIGILAAGAGAAIYMATQNAAVHYSGHLDLNYHSVCEDSTNKVVPCVAGASKSTLTEAINWYYASGPGHGVKYYDWQHITFNPYAHCNSGIIVEKWLYGVDTHTCACLWTGVTLPCIIPPTPKPGGTNG